MGETTHLGAQAPPRQASDDGWETDEDVEYATRVEKAAAATTGTSAPVPEPEFPFLSDVDLESVPLPRYQVRDYIVRGSNVFVVGQPGAGKTFFALDVGKSIARGSPVLGLQTERGAVIYIAGEGGRRGLAKRARAWSHAKNNGEHVPDFWVVPVAVPMLDPDAVGRFAKRVVTEAGRRVGMFVVDTLARSTAGADENTAGDMGRYVQACDVLRSTFGATVMSVHHPTKGADFMRGSGALIGAADTEIRMTKDSATGIITMSVTKQKDSEPPPDMRLRFLPVPEHHSCVLVPAEPASSATASVADRSRPRACLDALRALGPSRYARWLERSKAADISASSFDRYVVQLVAESKVIKVGDLYTAAVLP